MPVTGQHVAQMWIDEIDGAEAAARRLVEEDLAARGVSDSGLAQSAMQRLTDQRQLLDRFVNMAREATNDDPAAMLQLRPPIPLSWQLAPSTYTLASAVGRAVVSELGPGPKLNSDA